MSETPRNRTALTRQFYLVYLNSHEWKSKRNQKLRDVSYRCERCSSKRELQVHHRTYENLGHETSADLEVLCHNCHRGEHLEHPDQTGLGVYIKLVSTMVRQNPFVSIAELSEGMKVRCVSLGLKVDHERIHSALSVVCGTRLKTAREIYRESKLPPEGRPLTRDEARELWCRLDVTGAGKALKGMPALNPAEQTPEQRRICEETIAGQVADIRRHAVKRRPVMDRLKEIFGETV